MSCVSFIEPERLRSENNVFPALIALHKNAYGKVPRFSTTTNTEAEVLEAENSFVIVKKS